MHHPHFEYCWWAHSDNVRALILWLVDHDRLDNTARAACKVLEKPWHWSKDWERMQRGDSVDEDASMAPLLQASIALIKGGKAAR